jgi:hypothetical protein
MSDRPQQRVLSVPSIPSAGRVPYGRVGNEGRPSVAYTVVGLMVSSGVSSALQVSARPRVSKSEGGWAPSCANRVDGEAVLQPFNGKSGPGAAGPISPFGFGRVS